MFETRECASDARLSLEVDDKEQSCLPLQPLFTSRNNKDRRNSAWVFWVDYVKLRISSLLTRNNPVPGCAWVVTVKHIEHVKSYAPHIDHLVADLECRPHPTPLD